MMMIEKYMQQTQFKNLDTVEGSKGLCDSVAVDFKNFLSANGIESTIIEGIGYRPELHESAHQDWQVFKGKDQKFLAHVVVKVENTIIDLTGAQFNEEHANRITYPFAQFKKEWKQIKTPKALNN
jgi:hypothetical protein